MKQVSAYYLKFSQTKLFPTEITEFLIHLLMLLEAVTLMTTTDSQSKKACRLCGKVAAFYQTEHYTHIHIASIITIKLEAQE